VSVVRNLLRDGCIAVVVAGALGPLAACSTRGQGSGDGAAPAHAHASADAHAYAGACVAQHGLAAARPYVRVRYFGDNAATAGVILDLIRRGEKSVTFSTPALYAGQRARTPVVGDIVVVTDFAGRPGAVVRTTSVRIVPFNEITADDSRYEGPPVRPLDAWRRVHWAYFTRELAPLGQQPSETLPVTVERFELLCAEVDAARLGS
jgi:uncharacterized protein YhfF